MDELILPGSGIRVVKSYLIPEGKTFLWDGLKLLIPASVKDEGIVDYLLSLIEEPKQESTTQQV